MSYFYPVVLVIAKNFKNFSQWSNPLDQISDGHNFYLLECFSLHLPNVCFMAGILQADQLLGFY